MTENNPIAERLETLHESWRRFRERPRARLLVWRATPDEATLIDAFVARECDGEAARTPDLFVQLRVPFRSEHAHGFALTHALCAHHGEAVSALDAAERALSWRCPKIDESASDLAVLGSVLASFCQHHLDAAGAPRLVLWLDPSDICAPEAYLRWLRRALTQLPEPLCLLVVEDPAAATFTPLARLEPSCVTLQTCALDMPAAFASLVRSRPEEPHASSAPASSAGDQLCLLLTQLALAIEASRASGQTARRDADPWTPAAQLAARATELATAQGWPQLAASVQMMLAAGYGLWSRHLDAHGAYLSAERLAQAYEAAQGQAQRTQPAHGHQPAEHARQLRLHAKLGRAGALLTLQRHGQAAALYLEAAQLARSLADTRLELDGYRLASLCLLWSSDRGSRADEPRAATLVRAWQTGMRGLERALAMDADTRASSTLPYLADHLLRISETRGDYCAYQRPLADQLTHLLGVGWRARLPTRDHG